MEEIESKSLSKDEAYMALYQGKIEMSDYLQVIDPFNKTPLVNPNNLPGIKPGQLNMIMGTPRGLGKSNFNPCLEIYMGTGGECTLGEDWESLFYEPNKLLLIC